jgi:hypothetical protein
MIQGKAKIKVQLHKGIIVMEQGLNWYGRRQRDYGKRA